MAFGSLRSSQSSINDAVTTHNFSLSTPIEAGDVVFAATTVDSTGSNVVIGFDSTYSWTNLYADESNGLGVRLDAFVADGTEDIAALTFTSDIAEDSSIAVWVHRDWFGTIATGIEVASNAATSGDTTFSFSALNPTNWDVEDTTWYSVVCVDRRTITWAPANYSEVVTANNVGSSGCLTSVYQRDLAAASETPPGGTISSNDGYHALTIAVRPAAASGFNPYWATNSTQVIT